MSIESVNTYIKKNLFRIFLVANSIIVLIMFLGTRLSNNYFFVFTVLFYFLIYLIFCLYIFVIEVIDSFKKEPYNTFIFSWAVIFISVPIVIASFIDSSNLADSIKSFYAVSVGIGINYVIDSTIKYIESEIKNDSEKISLTKKASFTKILFNVIYISEYITFILLERIQLTDFEFLKNKSVFYTLYKLPIFLKLVCISMAIFLILMGIVIVCMNLIRSELKKESNNQTVILKNKIRDEIKEELSTISELKNSIKRTNEDIVNGLTQSHNQLQEELQKLDTKKK
ncbi:MAG: hypothetical protein E7I91_06905 [Streptococcus mitis]|nr:hypothetical protein [Streptococcus mitis]